MRADGDGGQTGREGTRGCRWLRPALGKWLVPAGKGDAVPVEGCWGPQAFVHAPGEGTEPPGRPQPGSG